MKYLKVIIVAILVGIGLAFFFFHNIQKEVKAFNNKSNKVYVFQAGVFKSKDNAYNYANELKSKVVYYDQEYYRVFVGVLKNYDNLYVLEQYFNNKNINYYIKEIEITEITDEFINYEKMLLEINNTKTIDKINQEMLNILITYLN